MPKIGPGLTAIKVRTSKPGRLTDRDGLILFTKASGTRFWILRYSVDGVRREMGLGRAGEGPGCVTLAEARQRTADMRRMIRSGIDPLAQREAEAATR